MVNTHDTAVVDGINAALYEAMRAASGKPRMLLPLPYDLSSVSVLTALNAWPLKLWPRPPTNNEDVLGWRAYYRRCTVCQKMFFLGPDDPGLQSVADRGLLTASLYMCPDPECGRYDARGGYSHGAETRDRNGPSIKTDLVVRLAAAKRRFARWKK